MLQKHNDYWCWTVKQHLTKSDEDCSRLEICLLRRWNSMKTAHKFNTELSHKPGNDNPLPSADAVVNENSHAQSIRRRLCLLGCDDGCLSTYIHASSDDATAELASCSSSTAISSTWWVSRESKIENWHSEDRSSIPEWNFLYFFFVSIFGAINSTVLNHVYKQPTRWAVAVKLHESNIFRFL